MAGRFNINLARDAGGRLAPIKLAAGKPSVAEDQRFFAVGGTAEAGAVPRVGLLVRASDGLVVATGVLFHRPTGGDPRWGMAFVLDREVVPGGPCDLVVQSRLGDGSSADRVTGLHLEDGDRKLVSVMYPTGGTLCAGSVGTYGSFSGADTKVVRVEVTGGGGGTLQDTAPYQNTQGFWSSVFTLAAGTSYSAQAFGDVNPSGQSGTFTVVNC